jgi:TRAP-type C4-dicarboxylate transport system permease small subunit
MNRFFAGLERLGRGLENLVLCTLLLVMVALAVWQIVARNFFDGGFLWADEFLKLLLLWLGLAGAVVASGEGKQIKMDVLSRFLPERYAALAELVTALFTAAVCALCAWHAGRFVLMEREFGSTLLGHVPAWIFQAVIPLAFGLIAWRYLAAAACRLFELFAKEPPCS